tara:strand:+ start:357 stop:1475 length:1119 start_codon:yes stop_codon:yes gene_type:complete
MPEKKNYVPYKGNRVNQIVEGSFVDDYNTWRANCQGISGDRLQVKHIDNLYVMLSNHMNGNIRAGSRNAGLDRQGAIQFIELIEGFVDSGDMFTQATADLIVRQSKILEKMETTGKDAGGKDDAFDPAFILFTEQEYNRAGEPLRERKVQGHYSTEWYAERNSGATKVPDDWMTGNNPPHQALFSETETEFAKPKGLLHIMKEAAGAIDDAELEVIVDTIPDDMDAADLDDVSAIEDFFNKVVRENTYWKGGRLLVNKVRRELQATEFTLGPKDQTTIRELSNLNSKEDPLGMVTTFKLAATATPIITLTDRALQRKQTNKAPDDYRAWQNSTKRGFDYRKTAREKFGEDTGKYKPDAKVISKMWQQILWRN